MTTPVGIPLAVSVEISGGAAYPVLIGSGLRHTLGDLLVQHAPAHRYAIISDSRVAALHGSELMETLGSAGLVSDLFTFPAGEASKIRKSWSRLSDELFAAGFGRDCCTVALGGGVTGDLAGFVAATFMRGVPVVQVPTSVVAMVDASVGGKTGVDAKAGKNLIGAFHPPRLVAADPDYIATLPREQRAEGLAEAVKHGAILDEDYLEAIVDSAEKLLDGSAPDTEAVVRRSVALKARVVSRDEREGGVRQILNFGHTLGHALEAESDYSLGHGSAVAIGMVLEARIGERLGRTQAGTAERIGAALHACTLPTSVPPELDPAAVVSRTRTDKKTRAGVPGYVILTGVGAVDREEGWVRSVPDEVVLDVLREAS